MKSLSAALLAGFLISLSLFWLMQAMLMSNQQVAKKSENLTRTDFVRLIRIPPEKPKVIKPPEPKPPEKKPLKVEKVQEVKKVEPKPKPQPKKSPQPPKPTPKQVVKREAPAPAPKLDLPHTPPKAREPAVNQSNAEVHGKGSLNQPVVAPPAPSKKVETAVSNSKPKEPAGGISSGVVALVRVPAVYPARAKRRRIEGKVTIEFTITSAGNVVNPVVVSSQPDGLFDDNALDAIRKWKFKQKIVNGVAVEQRAVQTMHFKLRDG